MKSKKMIFSIIIFIVLIGICSFCNAGVEIKDGTTKYTSVNISESFDICYNLRDGTSTLGTCSLEPHLGTALDLGAVAYLAQSRYGANASSVSNNSTGNQTGVMSIGAYTQTATLFESRNKTSINATTYRYRLEEALADSSLAKYVDVIPNTVDSETTLGRAIAETKNWYGASYTFQNGTNTDYPIIIRDSLFGVRNSFGDAGQAHSNVTFRPVIWN